MECVAVSYFHGQGVKLHVGLLFSSNRAIIITWFIVTVSALPVGLSHGTVEYYNHRNEINIACLFLTEEGYNHAAFQVRD